MRIIVITNDSTVFLHPKARAEDMFGGRVTEVRNLMNGIRGMHETVFGLISGRYGFVTGDTMIESYDDVPERRNEYIGLQERTDYSGAIVDAVKGFDVVMVFVPKDMMRILIQKDALTGNVISCTSPEFKDHFERVGWYFFERRGARIGKGNAERITDLISSSSFP